VQEPPSLTPPSALQDSGQAHRPEHPLDDQPIFGVAHSNFPAQPFDVGVTPFSNFGRRSSADETGDFSFPPRRRRLHVRLLAIGAAACLALGGVWALASGGSDEGATPARLAKGAGTTTSAPAASAPQPAALAPAPAQLPTGREPPSALAPTQPASLARGATARPDRDRADLSSTPNKASSKPVARPTKAVARPLPVSPKAAPKAPAKLAAKSAPAVKSAPAAKSASAQAPKARPQAKATKPGKRVRLSTDVLDPWDK
jgi:hypothetical protein